jgi:hypothetical protein
MHVNPGWHQHGQARWEGEKINKEERMIPDISFQEVE